MNEAPSSEQLLTAAADRLTELEYRAWRFGDSIAFEAMVEASRKLDQRCWRDFAHGFIRCWAGSDAEFRPLDCTAPGIAMIKLYEDTGDALVLECAQRLAGYLLTRPRLADVLWSRERASLRPPLSGERLSAHDQELLAAPPPGVYIDSLHMTPPLFVSLGQLTGEDAYVEEGAQQAIGYVRLLQDQESGLFHHFALVGQPRPYALGWGRGQGWALLGLLDLLRLLPRDQAQWNELADAATTLINRMLHLQRDDGSWHTVVDDTSSGAESSTAPFMEAGLRRAAALGLVSADHVADAIKKAREATLAFVADGALRQASDAVKSSTVRNHYAHVPVDVISPWSQGAFVLALAEE